MISFKKLLLFIFILFTPFFYCCEQDGQTYLTLVSSDCIEHAISKKVALRSKILEIAYKNSNATTIPIYIKSENLLVLIDEMEKFCINGLQFQYTMPLIKKYFCPFGPYFRDLGDKEATVTAKELLEIIKKLNELLIDAVQLECEFLENIIADNIAQVINAYEELLKLADRVENYFRVEIFKIVLNYTFSCKRRAHIKDLYNILDDINEDHLEIIRKCYKERYSDCNF